MLTDARTPTDEERRAGEVLNAVAAGMNWSIKRRDTCYLAWEMTSRSKSRYGLEITYSKGRFQITGTYPPDSGSSANVADMPTITVSAARPAEAIKAEIIRRLLPRYWRPFERVAKAKAAEERYRERTEREAAKLASIYDGASAMPYANASCMLYMRPGGLDATVMVHGGTASMDLRSIPAEVAAKVLAVLKDAAS